MNSDISLNIFTTLKNEALHTLQKVKHLSDNDFNTSTDNRDTKYCQDLIRLTTHYRHITTCIIYAACNNLSAAQADTEIKDHLHNDTCPTINTQEAEQYKEQLDISLQYAHQLIAGMFNQLKTTEINFSHCADIAYYNGLLSQCTNIIFQHYTSH